MNNQEMLDEVLKLLGKLPDALKRSETAQELLEKLRELKSIIVDKRAPRLAIIGRRGAGKSSLFNALVDEKILAEGEVDTTKECVWQEYELLSGGKIDWMDTPGLGAGQFKAERLKLLQQQFKEKRPDVVLFIHKASEVDSEIDSTLDDLRNIMECTIVDGVPSEVLAVLNQVDSLPSPTDLMPPYKPAKREKIVMLVEKMEEHLRRKGIGFGRVVPVASYFDEDSDLRYNIGTLAIDIARVIPSQSVLNAAAAFKYKQLQKEVANSIINTFSVACSGVALLPIPVSDIIPLTALQATMISTIGYLSGRKLSEVQVKEFIVSLGLLLTAAAAARQLFKIILPVFGEGASAALAAVTTKAIGAAAVAYYIDGKSMDEAKRIFKSLEYKIS